VCVHVREERFSVPVARYKNANEQIKQRGSRLKSLDSNTSGRTNSEVTEPLLEERREGPEGEKFRGDERSEEERKAGIWTLRDITAWPKSSPAGELKGREICFLSSSILSVFVQTSCISSTSCLQPVLTDGCFSLICTPPWTALPHWVKLLGKKPTWAMDYGGSR